MACGWIGVAGWLGRFARESHLSVRRGYWFMPRTVAGVPIVELLSPYFPVWLVRPHRARRLPPPAAARQSR
jgi:hypothetical protein